jgi:hypothetical protein
LRLPLIVLALIAAAAGCTSLTPLEQARVDSAGGLRKPECVTKLMRCDASGIVCEQAGVIAEGSFGTFFYWEKCEPEYEKWQQRIRDGRAMVMKLDPLPACFNVLRNPSPEQTAAVLDSLRISKHAPEASLALLEAGYLLGTPDCMHQYCQWVERNTPSYKSLTQRCADFRATFADVS